MPGDNNVSDSPGWSHESVLGGLDEACVLCNDSLQIPPSCLNVSEYSP